MNKRKTIENKNFLFDCGIDVKDGLRSGDHVLELTDQLLGNLVIIRVKT